MADKWYPLSLDIFVSLNNYYHIIIIIVSSYEIRFTIQQIKNRINSV